MAEGGVTDQVLDETQKELQECPICYTEYKDPRMLDCSHSFCLKCLQELRLTQNKDDKNIVCPLCRKETALTEAGVDMLPGGSKDVNQQEQTEGQGLKVMCQVCDEAENEAISRCVDCKHYLCQECQKAHNRFAALKSHKIVALTELPVESQEITGDTELKKVPKCREHPDEDLCLYCDSCEVLICNECTNFDHKESMHSHISVDEAFNKCKQEVHESVSKTEEYIKAFIAANPVSIKHSRYRLDKMLAKTYNQISQKAEKEIAKIRKKEKQLKKQARDIAMKRDKDFACAAIPQQTLSKVNEVMTTATCYEILESKKKMLWDLNEQVRVHKSLDINHGKSFLGFEESKEDGQLGTLLLEEKWERDKTFSEHVHGRDYLHTAAYSTSEIAVVCSDKLLTLDTTGNVISTKTYKPDKPNEPHDPNDIQNPTALAINKDDQLLILDNPAVKIFNKEYQLLHQFLPGKEAGVDGTPTCLAVDSNNLIAVGYKDKEQISLHNPDGPLVRTLPAPKVDTYLKFSNKGLIYTNYKEGLLMAVDLHGNKLFNQSFRDPSGLCCDDAGDIYLLASIKERNHVYKNICHFSADGKFIFSWNFGDHCDITYTLAHKLSCTGYDMRRYHLV
ncbi:uncharacterized protein LOC119742548 [Patiria miniata]|uniref:Tripartite motif-containing protein 2-like n=1 Tax=Patiria miniata TaxID=46514 RepID=A0A914BEJ0_PATMI|nr:uncharacterized protein LOC119742548 [Patiria miniata]